MFSIFHTTECFPYCFTLKKCGQSKFTNPEANSSCGLQLRLYHHILLVMGSKTKLSSLNSDIIFTHHLPQIIQPKSWSLWLWEDPTNDKKYVLLFVFLYFYLNDQ